MLNSIWNMLQCYNYSLLSRAPNSFLAGSAYRECMENGTWALKSNYSNCEPILEEKVSVAMQERSLYTLHSVHNLLIISDKCSSPPLIITLMARMENQLDIGE